MQLLHLSRALLSRMSCLMKTRKKISLQVLVCQITCSLSKNCSAEGGITSVMAKVMVKVKVKNISSVLEQSV